MTDPGPPVAVAESPMFPLGAVLHPSGLMPLHVFEPRYRAMMDHVMAGDRRFGVAMIERGSEVGGGDQRAAVATMAEIIRAQQSPDGRWAMVIVGRSRIRVREWLPDAPYPRALVEPWPYDDAESAVLDGLGAPLGIAVGLLRQALAMASELGERVPPAVFDLPDDVSAAIDVVAAAAPLGPFDRYRVLSCPTRSRQVDVLHELLTEQVEVLRARLG